MADSLQVSKTVGENLPKLKIDKIRKEFSEKVSSAIFVDMHYIKSVFQSGSGDSFELPLSTTNLVIDSQLKAISNNPSLKKSTNFFNIELYKISCKFIKDFAESNNDVKISVFSYHLESGYSGVKVKLENNEEPIPSKK